ASAAAARGGSLHADPGPACRVWPDRGRHRDRGRRERADRRRDRGRRRRRLAGRAPGACPRGSSHWCRGRGSAARGRHRRRRADRLRDRHRGNRNQCGALMSHATTRLDPVIHQPARLGILSAACDTKRIDFVSLRDLLDLTDGNLSRHLATLEAAGYIKTEKTFEKKKPRTWISATKAGRKA